ncbi:MAG: hypothetical protein M1830_006193 [Pleopsidium flavum]|nr:MAG: hypothetical protein M1830_006193 [Pleopsidium flavum]
MEITPAPQDPQVVEVRGPPRRRVTEIWSPRLQHDKRPVKRSIWKAPSLDEKAERSLLSRRNVQIIMFTVGFILPFAWMVASFLPLPPRPVVSGEKPTSRSDVEQAMEQSLGPIDEARYQNARWWRYVNRVMSIVGILILVTIIALAVVAARMRDS